jgi:hypothetical protein
MKPNDLEEFFRSKDCVCPFAASAVLHIVPPENAPRFDLLKKGVREFLPTEGQKPYHALVVMAPDSVRGGEAVEEWAIQTFLDLYVAFGIESGEPAQEVVDFVKQEIEPMLRNEADPRRPFLVGCAIAQPPQPLYSICITPELYQKEHPRWAPHTSVVVTWGSDVAEAQKNTKLVEQIRERAFSGHGAEYDADALVLEPKSKEPNVPCGAPQWLNVPCEKSATQFTDDDGMEFCTAHMGEWLKLFPTRQARIIED